MKIDENKITSTPSMLSMPIHVMPLSHETDAKEEDTAIIILRTMAGQAMYLAAKRTAAILDVRYQLAKQMALRWHHIHIMLAYQEQEDLANIHTLMEENGNVFDVLVEKSLLPGEFECPHCEMIRDFHECQEWDPHPEFRCVNCNEDNPHACCFPADE